MFECRGCGIVTTGRRTRVYCSNACQMAAVQRALVAQWLATGVAHAGTGKGHYVRTHLLLEQDGRCAVCAIGTEWNGFALSFVLDHIDGDADNNNRANLRLVCPNCDSQLPTYKSRNRGTRTSPAPTEIRRGAILLGTRSGVAVAYQSRAVLGVPMAPLGTG